LTLPINYKGIEVEANLKCDLFVENCLVVELKAIERVLPIHEAQLITYMKLLKVPIGLIINFNVTNIYKEGQKTYVNEFFRNLEE
jgi:GxxExxY protein